MGLLGINRTCANAVPAGDAFTTADDLSAALKNYPAVTTVGIWNSLTGVDQTSGGFDGFAESDVVARDAQQFPGRFVVFNDLKPKAHCQVPYSDRRVLGQILIVSPVACNFG